ncbi:MAG: anhydro-N-acetylmuramic acid kinase [Gammaproteobacteria bacterium]
MDNAYIGLISGTSTDAIDAVAVTIDDHNNIHELASLAYPIEQTLRDKIFSIQTNSISLSQIGELDTQVGEAFASAALALIESNKLDPSTICAIGSHGQTVKHDPTSSQPYSLQIGNPSIIAERTNITTVADFRRRDIAAGGQGAPLVLAFHQAWLGKHANSAVLNMGGIANITVLADQSSQPRLGFDTGPANTLLDAWTRKHLNKTFDENGQWSKSGKTNQQLLDSLMKHPFFRKVPPKSADISQFNLSWLENFLRLFPDIEAKDVAATLIDLTIASIKNALSAWATGTKQVIACGGGCRNEYLMHELSKRIYPIRLTTTKEFGIDVDWVEATAFAWLAKQTLEKKPGNAHHSTGAKHPCVLGGIYYK